MVDKPEAAQDVIDALRFALMAQDDPPSALRLVRYLLDLAPETESDRGVKMLLDLVCEGRFKVAMA